MTKSNKHWYARYVGDYMSKTRQLSMLEHGAYVLLMDEYYAKSQPLPTNVTVLYRVCSALEALEQAAVVAVLSQFFVLEPDGYHNKRADEEILRRGKISKVRAEAVNSRPDRQGSTIVPTIVPTATATTTEEEVSSIVSKDKESLLTRDVARKYPDEFEALWLSWPIERRKKKPAAYRAWQKCIKRVSPDYLKSCLGRYQATDSDFKRGFCPHLATWLNGEEWEQFQTPAKPEADANIADVINLPHGSELLKLFEQLQQRHALPVFRSWLAPIRVKSADSMKVILTAPTRFHAEWLHQHYLTDIGIAAAVAWPGVQLLEIEPKAAPV